MGTPYTFDEGMSCHSTRIELFYFDDNFRRIAQWVRPLRPALRGIFFQGNPLVFLHLVMVVNSSGR